MHQQVHTQQIVVASVLLSRIEVSDLLGRQVVLHFQKQRSGTGTTVGGILHLIQANGGKTGKKLGCTGRREEFSAFLTGIRCKQRNQNHVCCSQHIHLCIIDIEGNIINLLHDLCNQGSPFGYFLAEVLVLKVHVVKQLIECCFGFLSDGGRHQSGNRLVEVLDGELCASDFIDKGSPQVLRLDDVAEMFNGPVSDDGSQFFVLQGFTVRNTIVLQKLIHVVFGFLRQISVEDNTEDIVLKLAGIHIATKFVCDSPELGCQLLGLFLYGVSHSRFSFHHSPSAVNLL